MVEYLCVVNSRIGLWELWVGVGIEGVESKVTVVPWVSSCMGTNPILHSAGDLCHSAFIVPTNCFTISQESTALYTVPFKYQQLWFKCLL